MSDAVLRPGNALSSAHGGGRVRDRVSFGEAAPVGVVEGPVVGPVDAAVEKSDCVPVGQRFDADSHHST
jgi:hypothetical protein